jgi:elongation factor G
MSASKPTGPRSIALVGPYTSGKTTLLESILHATGATGRKGTAKDNNMVGDHSEEARARQMGTELNVATTTFMDDQLTFLDCPGSIELMQETLNAIIGVDAAVVVCEADPTKALALSPLLKALEDLGIPRMLFVNKIDKAVGPVQDLIDSLQAVSGAPLVLRHMPLAEGESITGYVDLASERSYVYRPNQPSEIRELPSGEADAVAAARYQMLETLADFDDTLMEKVLEEVAPEKQEVYGNLTKDYQEGLIVPVLLGAAESDNGTFRLLKALRHEAPAADVAAARVGVKPAGSCVAQVLKTYHTPHAGKLSVARIWAGTLKDGVTLNGSRVAGVMQMLGANSTKRPEAVAGEVVALGRLEEIGTGTTLSDAKDVAQLPHAPVLKPVYELAIRPEKRDDEVKMSGALARIVDEDPSLSSEHVEATHELVLRGQGDIHLKLACDRLKNKYGLSVRTSAPRVPYKEAIRKSVQQHGRHKKQSGGHGQFGDVHIEIKPLPRGTGFAFEDKIVGGAVPRQYIPAVEAGVRDYLLKGPLGFPVVDVSVTLYDGQYHSVDSSEMAFKTAGRLAMNEGMPKCDPVLLEPILSVEIAVPSEFTPKVNQLVSSRRGQLLGFDARPGWNGWDVVNAHLPQSEVHDLIVELRSLTQGTGTYTYKFERLQELSGRLADEVVNAQHADAAQ